MRNSAQSSESIAGRYRVVSRIAAGGMGEVYRARDSVLGRTVAVKVLPPNMAAQPGFVDRFRSEAQAAARLSHPNVVQVHDWGETDSSYFMVMEYVRGKNLREVLSSQGRLSPRQAAEVMVQVLEALDTAHRSGVVHRDVKPENIMLSGDGRVKVMDFGIARAIEGRPTAGMLGTVAYVSPEQARGAAVDGRSDVYSAGCVLFELLTGSIPFEGSAAEVLNSHLTSEVPAPSLENPEAKPLDHIVRRATAREPSERFQSADEMKVALASAMDSVPKSADIGELAGELTSDVPQELVETSIAAPRKSKLRRLIVPALILLFAMIASAAFALRPIRVPEVAGLAELSATGRLEDAGFTVESQRVFSDESVNTVVETDPPAGNFARRGSTVILKISKGAAVATLSDVTGRHLEEAKEIIEAEGFLVGDVTHKHDRASAGTVLDQDLGPGQVRKGEPVNLVVSDGPEKGTIPDVLGKPFDEANKILADAGFTSAREEIYSDQAPGTVLAQKPPAGTEAEKGSSVTLQVSKGSEPFAMPDVRGKTCADAKAQLEGMGLLVTHSSQSKAGCGSNKVLEQDPFPGATVRKGQEATLYVQ